MPVLDYAKPKRRRRPPWNGLAYLLMVVLAIMAMGLVGSGDPSARFVGLLFGVGALAASI